MSSQVREVMRYVCTGCGTEHQERGHAERCAQLGDPPTLGDVPIGLMFALDDYLPHQRRAPIHLLQVLGRHPEHPRGHTWRGSWWTFRDTEVDGVRERHQIGDTDRPEHFTRGPSVSAAWFGNEFARAYAGPPGAEPDPRTPAYHRAWTQLHVEMGMDLFIWKDGKAVPAPPPSD